MRFLHLSDLHLGKKINDINLLDDQKFVLNQINNLIIDKKIDCVLICGDIYQKSSPSDEAMILFDNFIQNLSSLNVRVFIISGNHDSSDKVSYLSSFLKEKNIFVSSTFSGTLQTITIDDEYGKIAVHLLPFIKPAHVRRFYPNNKINTYEDAIKCVLEHSSYNKTNRNIILSHQYITNAELSDSEELSLGGLDNIDASVYKDFDYVALGHIHKPQKCLKEIIRYSGSILKYSLSEANQKKSFTIVDFKEKGNIDIELIPIKFKHDVRIIKGAYEEIIKMPYSLDYVGITLTDEIVDPDARVSLNVLFPNMIRFAIENSKTKIEYDVLTSESIEEKSFVDLLNDFYKLQNNDEELTIEHHKIIQEILNDMEVNK